MGGGGGGGGGGGISNIATCSLKVFSVSKARHAFPMNPTLKLQEQKVDTWIHSVNVTFPDI